MTLTELSYYSKKSLPFIIIFFLIILIIFYLFKLIFLYIDLNKKPEIKINPVFGKIKSPILTDLKKESFNYILDTIDGEPISASPTANVYFIPPNQPKLGYRERVFLMASSFGFDTEKVAYQLVETKATFKDEKQILTIDISNYNFNYQYYLNGREGFFLETEVPRREEIERKAIDFLKNIGRYPDELAQGKINIIYLKFDRLTKNLTIVDQPSFANMIEVDFYRPEIDGLPVIPPKYFNSQNYLVMVFSRQETKVVKGQIQFFDRSKEEFGVYPIKSGNEAWEKLKQNQGLIVSGPNDKKTIKIKKMLFGYLDLDNYQEYLQPVYIFLGENNFVGYVPAVSDQYLIYN